MQIFLIKNNLKFITTFSYSLKRNKSYRFTINNHNFSFYKLYNHKFSNSDSKYIINDENKKEEFSIDDIDEYKSIKRVTLKTYINQDETNDLIQKTDNLPIKVTKIDNEEIEVFVPNKTLSKAENFQNYEKFLERKEKYEKEYKNHKMKIGVALFIFFIGLFSLWIPLYKSICENQGFSVKTTHTDYKFSGKKRKYMNRIFIV
jgi:hypothetical protein